MAMVAFGILVTGLVQTTWFTMIDWPGVTPPLTLVLVLSLALRRSPQQAALVGFLTGLLIDVLPPSTTPIGISAFAFCVVAAVVSMSRTYLEGAVLMPLLAAAGASVSVLFLRLVISLVTGASVGLSGNIVAAIITSGLYAAMLASFILPIAQKIDELLAPRQAVSIIR